MAQIFAIIVYYLVLRMEDDVWNPEEEYSRFKLLPKKYVGLDITDAGGPRTEPCRPLWLNLIAFSCCFLAIPFWTDTHWDEVSWVNGFPVWGNFYV
eukprot:UN04606